MFQPTALDGVLVATLRRHGDERGYFCETFRESWLEEAGVHVRFVQDNQAYSQSPGVLRGLHFQVGPSAQGKLVRVTRGAILDVAVDLRRSSPSFGRPVTIPISAADRQVAWIPVGFAHGYLTLEPDTEVLYKTTAYYDPSAERGLVFDDPDVAIAWPIPVERLTIAPRDRAWPRLAGVEGFA